MVLSTAITRDAIVAAAKSSADEPAHAPSTNSNGSTFQKLVFQYESTASEGVFGAARL